MNLLKLVKETGIVQIIDDMTRRMTIKEIHTILDEYVEEYRNTHNVEDVEDVKETRDFWRHISGHKLHIDFIRHFQEKLHWDMVTMYAPFVIDDIEEFEDKIVWGKLMWNKCLTMEIVLQYDDKINMKYVDINLLGEDFLIDNQDKYDY